MAVGHVYPLIRTFQVLHLLPQKSTRNAILDGISVLELKRVVAFWAVIAVMTFAEFFLDFFVFLIPMYYEAKLLFLLWLVHNSFSGALFFFDSFVDEILSKHEESIDQSLQDSKSSVRKRLMSGVGVMTDALAQAGIAALRKV